MTARLEPFDEWLRKGEGRCTKCGAHPATQGHDHDCDRKKRAPAARATPPTPKPRRNAWADREETTWIDRM